MAKNYYTIHMPNDAWHCYAVATRQGTDVSIKIDGYAVVHYKNARKGLGYYVEQAYTQLTGDNTPIYATFDFRTK